MTGNVISAAHNPLSEEAIATTMHGSGHILACLRKPSQIAIVFLLLSNVGFYFFERRNQCRPIRPPKEARGFIRRNFFDNLGNEFNYTIFVPFDFKEGSKPPVILFLNGVGDNGDDGVSHLRGPFGRPLWEQKARFPFIAVMPQCHKGSNWTLNSPDLAAALTILDQIEKEYETDTDRVYITGASAGGSATWQIATSMPNRFAAAAPVSGGRIDANQANTIADANLPIWNFVVAGDKNELVDGSRESQRKLLDAGASPLATELEGTGHDAWSFAYRSPMFFKWLLNNSRAKNRNRQEKFVSMANNEYRDGWNLEDESVCHVNDAGELICDLTHQSVSTFLSTVDAYLDFELHFSFCLDKATGFTIQLRSELDELNGSGIGIAVEIAESGRGRAFEIKTFRCLASFDPIVERTLNATGWNDIRIFAREKKISVVLNGGTLCEFKQDTEEVADRKVLIEIYAGTAIRIRHPRRRNLSLEVKP